MSWLAFLGDPSCVDRICPIDHLGTIARDSGITLAMGLGATLLALALRRLPGVPRWLGYAAAAALVTTLAVVLQGDAALLAVLFGAAFAAAVLGAELLRQGERPSPRSMRLGVAAFAAALAYSFHGQFTEECLYFANGGCDDFGLFVALLLAPPVALLACAAADRFLRARLRR